MRKNYSLLLIAMISFLLIGCGTDESEPGARSNSPDLVDPDLVDPDPVDPDPVDPDPVDPDPVDPDPVDPESVLLRFDEGRLNQSVLG